MRRGLVLCGLLLFGSLGAQAPGETEPDVAMLRRLAAQIGAGSSTPKISPEMLELAKKYLQANPQLMKDPAFQQKMQAAREQMAKNPDAFRKQLQEGGVTKEQLDQFRREFPSRAPQPPTAPLPRPAQPPNPQPVPNPERPGAPPQNTNPPTPRPQAPNTQNPPPTVSPRPLPGQQNNPQLNPQNGQPPTGKADLAKNNEGFRAIAGMWEQNVGPLDKTPALKKSLVDMFSGTGDGQNPFGNGAGNGQQWWKNGNNASSQNGFVNWLRNTTSGGAPGWLKNLNLNTGNWNLGSGGGAGNFGGGGWGGGGGLSFGGASFAGLGLFGIIIVSIIAVAVIAFVLYRYWPQIQQLVGKPKPLPGAGAWPVDPRDVHDRATLILAFEYLSVFLCGDAARVWNHRTIAEALRELIPAAVPLAEPLARLYALARYTPEREVIPAADIAEARGYLCTLAGVSGS